MKITVFAGFPVKKPVRNMENTNDKLQKEATDKLEEKAKLFLERYEALRKEMGMDFLIVPQVQIVEIKEIVKIEEDKKDAKSS